VILKGRFISGDKDTDGRIMSQRTYIKEMGCGDMVERRIFGVKMQEVTREWRKLHHKKLLNL
jgi:hypothetical protein